MDCSVNLAIVGATGAVGRELLKVLEKRNFPVNRLKLFTSPRSLKQSLHFKGQRIPLEVLEDKCFAGIDIAIFSAGQKVANQWAPLAVKQGARVVDNSSAFRLNEDVPLIIPEINSHALRENHFLISSPNCSATIMLMVAAPLHRHFKIARIAATTYQAASGAGFQAMKELEEETSAYLEGRPFSRTVMPHPYAFNLFPHNSPYNENGYAEEELKMIDESRKILEEDRLRIHATCIRVPVLRAHSEALNITFNRPVSVEEAYQVLKDAPGVAILEDRENNRFPMPSDASGLDEVLCGRIRMDASQINTLDLWVVGDQLLKGAALNAVQIAELLMRIKKPCVSI